MTQLIVKIDGVERLDVQTNAKSASCGVFMEPEGFRLGSINLHTDRTGGIAEFFLDGGGKQEPLGSATYEYGAITIRNEDGAQIRQFPADECTHLFGDARVEIVDHSGSHNRNLGWAAFGFAALILHEGVREVRN